jgi:hypothetical protein
LIVAVKLCVLALGVLGREGAVGGGKEEGGIVIEWLETVLY